MDEVATGVRTGSTTLIDAQNQLRQSTQNTRYSPSTIRLNPLEPKAIVASIQPPDSKPPSAYTATIIAGILPSRGGPAIGVVSDTQAGNMVVGLSKQRVAQPMQSSDSLSSVLKKLMATHESMPLSQVQPPYVAAEDSQEGMLHNTPIIVGKVPTRSGSALGIAYMASVAVAWHKERRHSTVEPIGAVANHMTVGAAELRGIQIAMRTDFTPIGIIRNVPLEAKASLYEMLDNIRRTHTSPLSLAGGVLSSGGREVVGKAEGALQGSDDVGVQAVGGLVEVASLAYSGFKVAQNVSPVVLDAVKDAGSLVVDTAKNTIDVIFSAGRATVAVANTIKLASVFSVPIHSRMAMSLLQSQVVATGLNNTALSRRIVDCVLKVQRGVANVRSGIGSAVHVVRSVGKGTVNALYATGRVTLSAGSAVKSGVANTVHIVRGVTNGTISASVVSRNVLAATRDAAIKGATVTGKATLHVAGHVGKATLQGETRIVVKGTTFTIVKGLPKAASMAGGLSMGTAGMLSRSNDTALQGVGGAISLTNHSVRTAKVMGKLTGRAIKTSVKTTVRTSKAAVRTVSFIKNHGLRASWRKARQKTGQAVAKAGQSVVSAAINIVKALGRKIIMPILLIVCAVVAIQSILAAPLQAIGAIFGGLFGTVDADGNYIELDIHDYLLDPVFGLPALRVDYINDLALHFEDQYIRNGGSYHIVRFYTNASDDVVGSSSVDIESVFLSLDDLINIVQPIFNAIILMDYELEPSESEAKAVLNEIFGKMFRTTEGSTVEWCGNTIYDGLGTPDTHSCGRIHAFADCPNKDSGTHGSYVCWSCCYVYCPGHLGSHFVSCADDCTLPHLYFCIPPCTHVCNGYSYCAGHDVLSVTLTMDGIYQLTYEYFLEPIERLENLAVRTAEEEDELQSLKDCYEICLEYIKQVSVAYGGMTLDDLSDVAWVTGSRTGNIDVIDLALSQVGQAGGQPYWSYYGFASRVEWCACFVHWCYNVSGYGVDYGTSNNNASCDPLVAYFKGRGVWQNGGYTNLAIGDPIFFNWNGDGSANHVGIVIGSDDTYVYTVEGNSGDSVKIRCYSLNSSVILGYAVFND